MKEQYKQMLNVMGEELVHDLKILIWYSIGLITGICYSTKKGDR